MPRGCSRASVLAGERDRINLAHRKKCRASVWLGRERFALHHTSGYIIPLIMRSTILLLGESGAVPSALPELLYGDFLHLKEGEG